MINQRLLWFLAFGILTILAGCSGSPPRDRSNFAPIKPDPTATAISLSGTTGPGGKPTSVVSDLVNTSAYTHPTNRFSIDYPENWQVFDRPHGVLFIEPGSHAAYSVIFSEAGESYSEKELNQFLVTFVAKNFVDDATDFSVISQETRADDSVVAQFSSVDPNLGQTVNEARVWQRDKILFVVVVSATEEQWQISRQKLQRLADTLTILDTGPVVQPTPTEKAVTWNLIGPTSNQFAFLTPSDWQILHQTENQVTVKMADYDITFEGAVSDWPEIKPEDPVTAAEKAVLAYLETISEEPDQIEHTDPAEFPLDELSGATVDFLYTTPEGKDMAGSLITAVSEGQLYRITFMAPAEMYEGALQWFNPMYKSFTILPAEELIEPIQ